MISPQDLDRFDNLVLKREIESMKARQPAGPSVGTDSYSMMSYSDTISSSSSHFTSTTVSSARVSLFLLFLHLSVPAPGSPTASSHPSSAIKAFPQHGGGSSKAFLIPLQGVRGSPPLAAGCITAPCF